VTTGKERNKKKDPDKKKKKRLKIVKARGFFLEEGKVAKKAE